jgi:glycosyltransferase involved in cell wall biosynthesis
MVCEANGESMAEKIITLIKDNEQTIDLGKNARQAAENHFSYSKLISLWEKFYQLKFKSVKK